MLKIENLTKVYPNGTQALKNVSFEVKDGEFPGGDRVKRLWKIHLAALHQPP